MTDLVVNILSLGIKPLYERQLRFHKIISEFRNKLSRLQDGDLTVADIDKFYNDLNNFDFRFVLFAEYYKKYVANLNRFKPNIEEENPDVTFLLIAIAEDKWKPTEFSPLFLYHLRYKFSLTSRFFISHQKKQNRKKLDVPGVLAKQNGKINSSQKWTRVPIRNSKDQA